MTDKAEVIAVATLAEGFGADEIDVMKVAVVDDVAIAEHRAEAFQNPVLGENVLIQAFHCLKMVILFGIFRMPDILPALSGAYLNPSGIIFRIADIKKGSLDILRNISGVRAAHICVEIIS